MPFRRFRTDLGQVLRKSNTVHSLMPEYELTPWTRPMPRSLYIAKARRPMKACQLLTHVLTAPQPLLRPLNVPWSCRASFKPLISLLCSMVLRARNEMRKSGDFWMHLSLSQMLIKHPQNLSCNASLNKSEMTTSAHSIAIDDFLELMYGVHEFIVR